MGIISLGEVFTDMGAIDERADLVRYSSISKFMIQTGLILPVDLYVYLMMNQSIVLFRRKGDTLVSRDLVQLANFPAGAILVLKSDYEILLGSIRTEVAAQLKEGHLNSTVVQSAAKGALSSASIKMSSLTSFVQKIIQTFEDNPSWESYFRLMKEHDGEVTLLMLHHRGVSALGVLILMALGGGTLEDLADIAAAGLIHDLGMDEGPAELLEKHCQGQNDFNPTQKISYSKHPGVTLDILKHSGVTLSPGAIRIIQQHHENWDGSGFAGLVGTKIDRCARILRIADEWVCWIERTQATSFQAVLPQMTPGHFDPQIIASLRGLF